MTAENDKEIQGEIEEEESDDSVEEDNETDALNTRCNVNTETKTETKTEPKDSPLKGLSKRALKRIKKSEVFEATKGSRRAAERERRKRRATERRELKESNPECEVESLKHQKKRLRRNTMATSDSKVKVVIDCGFDHLMENKGITKLCKQIQYSYTTNRRLPDPLQLYVTGLNDQSEVKKKFDLVYEGSKNWDIHIKEDHYDQVFENQKLVYLTSESENVLKALDEDKTYVIGGLVDHNQHKGICHKLAQEKGITHAKLPIEEFLEMKTRRVLTVNCVFDILAGFAKSGDWKQALVEAIPERKGAVDKEGGEEAKAGEEPPKKKKKTNRGKKKRGKKKRRC